ncbi:acylneuraminate cytidylyltransferase family protein [Sediminibacterium roseum]|uniref:Acylneuraminate cytidylyltransferase family protein n=1 Tax=Sediminibacterium roseum TaxID=1978412 RepID=A0ABW9ZW30_9BACT|nr:acylneuraminate cytidylyltransferase family protein [Sediminibacterium roseum]NCI49086.1 acylneuraminate cytidylyltransferase family protein [Sediminibacterium roseum]
MLLAIIPARYGSKGVPRKNVVDLNGQPLISYTIEAALQSSCIDEILVTTDDDEVIALAEKKGINCRYKRPSALATDETSMYDVVEHALEWFKTDRGFLPEQFVLLQPTSPLRSAADIDNSMAMFIERSAESLISVHALSEHPFECIKIDENGWSFLAEPAHTVTRRQDFKQDFHFINGAIYLIKTETFLAIKKFFIKSRSLCYVMPKERGIDIDSVTDLAIAKALLQYQEQDKEKLTNH